MTSARSLAEYVELVAREPAVTLGAFGRAARALDAGQGGDIPEDVRRLVAEVALSARAASPILHTPETAWFRDAVAALLGDDRPYTYAWKTAGGEAAVCPFRHDPVVLLPERSRQDILAACTAACAYVPALESRSLCPWCAPRYRQALARAEGVWQRLAEEIVVQALEPAPADAPVADKVRACNRWFGALRLAGVGELLDAVAAVRGSQREPAVTGFVFLECAEEDLRAWEQDAAAAGAMGACVVLRAAAEERAAGSCTREGRDSCRGEGREQQDT